uniref:Fibroblast growth factor 8/17/18 n=1 Tax=Alitta virens TaxID=880429 RepID=A0A8F2EH98_ALIVI|nr:fibroblast growth factor 8/17/18 [Alitta virens]
MVSSKVWPLGWKLSFTMENMEVTCTGRLEDDNNFVCLLIMQGLLFTCFLLSQFCLSLISASKDSSTTYRISADDPTGSWRQLRDSRRMPRDSRAHAHQQYTRILKLQNQCSHKFVQIAGNIVNAASFKESNKTDLRLRALGSGHVTIESVRFPDNYLCFNRRGRLVVAQFGYKKRRCKFVEEMTPDRYSMFRSVANTRWRIGFRKKRGKRLMGYDTKRKEDCFKFQKLGNTLFSEGTSVAIERGRNSPPSFQSGLGRFVKERLQTADSASAVVSKGRQRARPRARSRIRGRNKKRDNT